MKRSVNVVTTICVLTATFVIASLAPAAAQIQAAYQSDAMLDTGDLDGAAVWRRIVAVINELQRERRKTLPTTAQFG